MNNIMEECEASTDVLQNQVDEAREKSQRELAELRRQLQEKGAELERSRHMAKKLQEEVWYPLSLWFIEFACPTVLVIKIKLEAKERSCVPLFQNSSPGGALWGSIVQSSFWKCCRKLNRAFPNESDVVPDSLLTSGRQTSSFYLSVWVFTQWCLPCPQILPLEEDLQRCRREQQEAQLRGQQLEQRVEELEERSAATAEERERQVKLMEVSVWGTSAKGTPWLVKLWEDKGASKWMSHSPHFQKYFFIFALTYIKKHNPPKKENIIACCYCSLFPHLIPFLMGMTIFCPQLCL